MNASTHDGRLIRQGGLDSPVADRWTMLAMVVLALALVAKFWVGYLSSDDAAYTQSADAWLSDFPYVAKDHWGMRHTVVLPIAASFALFGRNEFTAALPTLLYWAGLVLFSYGFLRRFATRRALVLALPILLTAPLFVIQSSAASADIAETFFIGLALWLFITSDPQAPKVRRLFWCGVVVGLAFLSRDTALSLILFLFGCFVFGAILPRRQFLPIAVGAALVFIAETVYFAVTTGSWLHRADTSLHHDSTVNRAVDLAGNVLVNPLVDPLLMLLANQEFALIFVLGVPLALWGRRRMRRNDRRPMNVFGLYALFWLALFIAVGNLLPLNPRYAMSATYAVLMMVLLVVARLFETGAVRAAAALVVVFTGTNLLCLSVENRHPIYAVDALVDYVRQHPGSVRTDPETKHRAAVQLRWQGLEGLVVAGMPRQGELFFYNPTQIRAALPGNRIDEQALLADRSHWHEVQRFAPPSRDAVRLIDLLGMRPLVPARIMDRLTRLAPEAVLYSIDP